MATIVILEHRMQRGLGQPYLVLAIRQRKIRNAQETDHGSRSSLRA